MADTRLFFRQNLLAWYAEHARDLPWKADRDPYKIWLSEVILQQTQVAQGLPYYQAFVAAFPRVQDLAAATEAEVFALWQGLGYYARARNLHRTAKAVCSDWQGVFPQTYAELRALPGVGDYTAAAIASFAYGLSHAVLDGNVYRVLARYLGEDKPIDSTAGKRFFTAEAQAFMGEEDPAAYNQAIMDFGATHCKPRQARCADCPLQSHCQAHAQGRVYDLPVKGRSIKRRARYFHYLIIADKQGYVQLEQRQAKDIWQGLYQPPLLEVQDPSQEPRFEQGQVRALHQSWRKQVLSHQDIFVRFWALREVQPPRSLPPDFQGALPKALADFFGAWQVM